MNHVDHVASSQVNNNDRRSSTNAALILAPGLNGPQIGPQHLGLNQEVHPELSQPLQMRLGGQLLGLSVPGGHQLFEPLLQLPRPTVGGGNAAGYLAGHEAAGPATLTQVQQSANLTAGQNINYHKKLLQRMERKEYIYGL